MSGVSAGMIQVSALFIKCARNFPISVASTKCVIVRIRDFLKGIVLYGVHTDVLYLLATAKHCIFSICNNHIDLISSELVLELTHRRRNLWYRLSQVWKNQRQSTAVLTTLFYGEAPFIRVILSYVHTCSYHKLLRYMCRRSGPLGQICLSKQPLQARVYLCCCR